MLDGKGDQVFAGQTITIVPSHYIEIANHLMIRSPTAGLYSILSTPQTLPAPMAGTGKVSKFFNFRGLSKFNYRWYDPPITDI